MILYPNEKILVGGSPQEAISLAADRVVQALSGTGKTASVALAGGSTPAALYSVLSGPDFRDRVDWQHAEWFWGDERCVSPEHTDSNYRMAVEKLLNPLHITENRIHRMPADATGLDAAARDYEQTIRDIVPAGPDGVPILDLVLLGIGNDGHTASLFPGSAGLHETRRLVTAHHVPSLNVQRMTMTYPLLCAAKEILFFVTGAGKAEIIAKVLSSKGTEPYPAAALRDAPGRVIWVLDADAARLVQSSDSP